MRMTLIATALGGRALQDFRADLAVCRNGELRKGLARSCIGNGNGTITDARTGLRWGKLSDDGSSNDWDTTYAWTNAFAKIATLNGGGGS